MARTRVTSEHDLFFAVFHHAHQLAYLHRLEGWRERCSRAVCLLIEQWTPYVDRDADYLRLLEQFDEVYVVNPAIVRPLADLGVPPPRYLAMAVDALLMRPGPHWPERVLDVYSYGRRSATVHRQLLELSARDGLTYLYDSLAGAQVTDHREHRQLLGNLMKRSSYFLAHTINDSPERRARTGGDEAISTRYFEAAAGGAVMLGSRPLTPTFDAAFPWEHAVVDLPYEYDDVRGVLAALDAEPERLARARAAGVHGSLTAHDWAHRWATVLDDARLAPDRRLTARLTELEQAAAEVTVDAMLRRG